MAPKGADVNSAAVDGSAADNKTIAYWDATDTRWEDQPDGSDNEVTENPSLPGSAPGTGLPVNTGGKTGDVWYQVTLPFGSFTLDQPPVVVQFGATLDGQVTDGAVVGDPLGISATGGFKLGELTPVNDPAVDTPISIYGPQTGSNVIPTVILLDTSASVIEGGTATQTPTAGT